jgi:D-tyrosyl-tRNA(Tyr) deacylase
MRAVVQRVLSARVTVDGRVAGEIGAGARAGLLILAGVHRDDTEGDAELLARKISQLRIFADADGKMNLSLEELGGESLVVSQFTLFADLRKGRRPSFFDAAPPDMAIPLLETFCRNLSGTVHTGQFGAHMHVESVNDGPVTIVMDTTLWTGGSRPLTDRAPDR